MNERHKDASAVDPHHVLGATPVHYLHELPFADEQRLEELFKKLDKDRNGRIDIHDLSEALKDLGLSHQYAEVWTHITFTYSENDSSYIYINIRLRTETIGEVSSPFQFMEIHKRVVED